MKKIIHRSESRGLTATNWLVSRHTFSFADYYDPERMQFGALRVLNDDMVIADEGFDTHHHENMEIVTIPLQGSLKHADSAGHEMIIKTGDIQIMSAGTGVDHSEHNASNEPVHFLQIWIIPKKLNISPRYEQKTFDISKIKNHFYNIVSPVENQPALFINQDAWFFIGEFEEGMTQYQLQKPGNGVYVFIIEGKIEIEGEALKRRDGIAISDIDTLAIKIVEPAKLLIMEVAEG